MRTKSTTLLDNIASFIDKEQSVKGRAPTLQEIANEMKIAKSSASNYVAELTKRGLLFNNGGSRGLMTQKMMKTKGDFLNLAVVGDIACGTPILAEENIQTYLPIPKEFLGNGNFFILKAKGDSMIEAGIDDGDYVIIKQQETAEEGQIIVALIDNEATLKRYYMDKENKQIILHPENTNMKDMYFKNITIQGVAKKVVKNLL